MPRPHRWLAFAALCAAVASVPAQETEGRKYALLVGVKDYKGTDLASLKYTENDVEEFAALLKAGGFRRVTLLTQSEAFVRKNDDFFPTADNVRDALKITLTDRNPADTVLIAFAGHGVQLREPAGMYFCPQKADLSDPKTLVALDEVYAALKECKAGTRLLVVDACRNDPTAGRSATVANLASASRPELPKPPGGVAALFSCSAGERAFESDKLKHGVFFHHLIEGLKGKAAGKNGEVDLLGLAQYVMTEVPETTHDEYGLKASQRPHLLSDAQRVMLVKVSAAPAIVEKSEPAPVPPVAARPTFDVPVPPAASVVAADVLLPDNAALAFGINLAEIGAGTNPIQQAVNATQATMLQLNGVTNVRR